MSRFLFGLILFVFCIVQIHSKGVTEQIKFDYGSVANHRLDAILDSAEREAEKAFYRKLIGKGISTGFSNGLATGYDIGLKSAEGLNFFSSFECATHGCKRILEDCFTCGEWLKKSFKGKLELPDDILNITRKNDDWINVYNPPKPRKKGPVKATSTVNVNVDPKATSPVTDEPSPVTDEPTTHRPIEDQIQYSFETWYSIVTSIPSKGYVPRHIERLRNTLYSFYKANTDTYTNLDLVYLRFAAHMARSFKMMCALHHKANNVLKHYAEENPDEDFISVLLEILPQWYMSAEQVIFLNILRSSVPNQLEPLLFVYAKNSDDELIVIPHDNNPKYCGRLKLKELTTPIGVHIFETHSTFPLY